MTAPIDRIVAVTVAPTGTAVEGKKDTLCNISLCAKKIYCEPQNTYTAKIISHYNVQLLSRTFDYIYISVKGQISGQINSQRSSPDDFVLTDTPNISPGPPGDPLHSHQGVQSLA